MDSPLEESGFELVVPPSFLSWPGRQRDHLDQREEPVRSPGGTSGSNPVCSSAESANYQFRSRQAASAVFPNLSTRFTSPIGRLTGSMLSFS